MSPANLNVLSIWDFFFFYEVLVHVVFLDFYLGINKVPFEKDGLDFVKVIPHKRNCESK